MIGAVLDTNVVVSALLNPTGPTASILDLAARLRFRCYVSREILEEYRDVLGRPYLGLNEIEVHRSTKRLERSAVMVEPRRRLQVCIDPDDDIFLECALEARSNYIVTGNARHYPTRFQDIRVILPRQFLTVLAAEPR